MRKRRFLCAVFALALICGVLRAKRLLSPAEPPAPSAEPSPSVVLRVLHEGGVAELSMEDYLIGVVAAEMPADFETEALRAQAVAARTFTLYCARTGKHRDADVCTDHRCCQAWKSPAAMCEAWGERFEEKLSRVRAAVDSTAGQYLSFAGEAVFAAFHSSSAGFTEDCDAIWSGLPYLVSVSSPESADSVPNYVSCVACSPQDLRDALLTLRPEADFSGEPTAWLGEIARDRSGRVAEAVIGGAVFPGVKLRELFGLRSTAFELDFDGEAFQFTVTGFGHGVGMSQYGANVMAAQGADYTAILAHYYPGTELVQTLS